jgi:EPS-associated MarR family transcriptional regulator
LLSPSKKLKTLNPDLHFKLLKTIEGNPSISQRELAKELGVSLGSINYCLKALINIGHIKLENFNSNPNKLGYLYLLTKKGLIEKASLTVGFLNRKKLEYEALKKEIDSVQNSLGSDQR